MNTRWWIIFYKFLVKADFGINNDGLKKKKKIKFDCFINVLFMRMMYNKNCLYKYNFIII